MHVGFEKQVEYIIKIIYIYYRLLFVITDNVWFSDGFGLDCN